jgi:hypothetical protein
MPGPPSGGGGDTNNNGGGGNGCGFLCLGFSIVGIIGGICALEPEICATILDIGDEGGAGAADNPVVEPPQNCFEADTCEVPKAPRSLRDDPYETEKAPKETTDPRDIPKDDTVAEKAPPADEERLSIEELREIDEDNAAESAKSQNANDENPGDGVKKPISHTDDPTTPKPSGSDSDNPTGNAPSSSDTEPQQPNTFRQYSDQAPKLNTGQKLLIGAGVGGVTNATAGILQGQTSPAKIAVNFTTGAVAGTTAAIPGGLAIQVAVGSGTGFVSSIANQVATNGGTKNLHIDPWMTVTDTALGSIPAFGGEWETSLWGFTDKEAFLGVAYLSSLEGELCAALSKGKC